MKRLAWFALIAVGVASAQVGPPVRIPFTNGPLKVTRPADLMPGLQAMPVVAAEGGGAVVAAKINAAQARVDRKVEGAVLDCRSHPGQRGAWTRRIEIVMKGPRYVSVVAHDAFTCGGAPPGQAILPLVYDLNSGGTVNWLKLLPPGAVSGVDDAVDGNKVGAVIWPVLTAMARAQGGKACGEAFDSTAEVSFLLWLDAIAGAIKAQPNSLPHALAACAVPVTITVEQARSMGGFNAEMLDALEAAHKLQR